MISVDNRISELLSQMTIEEKAGLFFHSMAWLDERELPERDGDPLLPGPVHDLVVKRHITHLNVAGPASAQAIARFARALAALAETTRLRIPITLSSDPRSAATERAGASHSANGFSQWPEPIGIAAMREKAAARRFGEAVSEEFAAAGIRLLLGPQVDVATEPRWSRINGTWGGDAALTVELVTEFIEGLQVDADAPRVTAMVKHFPGGGPQKDGEDPHFPHGKDQVYPGGHFDEHLSVFPPLFAAGARQTMAYYGRPVGLARNGEAIEEVGFAFNRQILTDLLRDELGFEGLISTDWGVIEDAEIMGDLHVARAWGVEHLDRASRVEKALNAGVDQFGGDSCTELIVQLVAEGRISESRLDESARRILEEKFRLGLFDGPAESEGTGAAFALSEARRRENAEAGLDAQRRSLTLLTNADRPESTTPTLPLPARLRVFSDSVDNELLANYATVVTDASQADVAIMRVSTPWEPRPTVFENFFHSGRLDFPADELASIVTRLTATPTVVVVGLERPAVIPEIVEHAAAVVGEYGSCDEAVLDVLFGRARPEGRLPFQLPRSMDDVVGGETDTPHRLADPLFDFGHGLDYPH
ncbi:glycoside hydrolase family 3 C-terminal domain-containing protein [Microbacterium sp. STN6]|uniref:glycoside hydrolase family 3 protein n=1 Tax=Microbacterium sp. STN6 TaxID=2995588 RepID=UPI002261044C|nr:glycoside hydrolase family 3 protein [Microbacterium sp. STN6]MCX7522695.1 glycoside hydrolase family 3 C-terminal domain-containing protein [Microbacterium sp. STN6]